MTDKKPEEIKEVKENPPAGGEECEKKASEYLAGWQRARADFLNYKKEEMERIGEFLKYASEEFVLKIIPVLDNFEMAEKNLSEDIKNSENIKGILQIKKQLEDFLKNQGVEEIKTAGEKFDLNFMEAVQNAEEERKGYKINGRLLRPAKVRVTK